MTDTRPHSPSTMKRRIPPPCSKPEKVLPPLYTMTRRVTVGLHRCTS